MLEPSLPFYLSLFGAMMMGAISVPLFTLFGLDGLRLRVDDCKPKLLITNAEKREIASQIDGLRVVVADAGLLEEMARFPTTYQAATRADDMAVFQYTSGTTRELPAAVKHSHRTLVTLMFAALYGTGIRPGDEFFCPSSPAWGHGLWHGTLAPLALGVTTGTFAGRFDAVRLMKALQDYKITNMSAAATHYRMMKNSGKAEDFTFSIKKLSYTGEPIDPATLEFIDETFHVPACSMYGTTEIGVVLVNYPGRRRLRRQARLAGQAGARAEAPGAEAGRHPDRAGGRRRTHAVATRQLGDHQGPREDRRGRLFLSCRPRGRRDHLGRLDDERG